MITEPLAAGRKPHNRTWAVIICYRPQQELVAALARALLIQAEQVLILDNDAASSTLDLLHIDRVIHVPMPSNLGTAAAMNRAWQMALQANAEFVICFDQDSVVSDNLIASLLSRWQQLKENGYQVYAIEQTHNSIALDAFSPPIHSKIALVFGNEAEGVSEDAIKSCNGSIEIPQFGSKHSFNISVSAGIVLWDIFNKSKMA